MLFLQFSPIAKVTCKQFIQRKVQKYLQDGIESFAKIRRRYCTLKMFTTLMNIYINLLIASCLAFPSFVTNSTIQAYANSFYLWKEKS